MKHSSNVSLNSGRFRTSATFQTKCFVVKDICFQQLTVVWKSSFLDLLGQRYGSPIFISSIFAFEKINHFCLVFKWYIEKDLHSKACFSQISNTSWHLHETVRIIKYHSQLQIWRAWIIICSSIAIYSNVIEKTQLDEKLIFADISKIDPSF